jgi:hypothetical protein
LLKFTTLVAALVTAVVTAVSVHPPSSHAHVQPGPFQPAPPSRMIMSENADHWQQVANKQQADDEAAARAAAEAQAAAEAKAAEEARLAAAAAAAAARPRVQAPAQPAAVPPGSVQEIIVKAFSPYGQTAVDWGLRVAGCESGYNPRAYNPAGPYYGLFQFLMSTFKNTPYGNQDIYDPYYNAAAAAWKYSVSGPGAWGCK